MTHPNWTARAASAAAATAMVALLGAQQPTIQRTILQRGDLSMAGREAVTANVEIPPGASAGRHTHPGEEVGYMLEGAILLEIDGQPAATRKAGETFLIPAGKIHNATNRGTATARVLATYIVEKGKTLVNPVP